MDLLWNIQMAKKKWYNKEILYLPQDLLYLINSSFYLGKERGRYNLEWLKFLTEEGVKEFPIIPGMEHDVGFREIFDKLSLEI